MKAIKATPEIRAFFGDDGSGAAAAKALVKKIRSHVRLHQYKNPDALTTVYDQKIKALFGGKDRVKVADIANALKTRILK